MKYIMEYISLGGDCAVAYQLQKYGLRTNAYPLDWVLSPTVQKCLEHEFYNLLDTSVLTWKNKSNSFPLIDEDWKDRKDIVQRVVQSCYNITFLHDISDVEDLPSVVQKYERRIARFKTVMKDPTIVKKCFRMGKKEPLTAILKTLGYVNIHLYQCENVQGSDWKKNEWDWCNWFKSEPDEYIHAEKNKV